MTDKLAARKPIIRLFGRLEVWSRHGNPVVFSSEKSKQLFAFVALERGAALHRGALIARLWQEGPEDKLRRQLSTEIWRLRCALARAGEDPTEWLVVQPDGLSLNTGGGHWIDTEAFDAMVAAPDRIDGSLTLGSLDQLYRGDLLSDLDDTPCLMHRTLYRERFIAVLEALLRAAKRRGDWPEVLDIARRIVAEDSYHEEVHREIMNGYAALGKRAAALRHYQALQRMLREELDIEPARETTRLYNALRSSEHEPEAAAHPAAPQSGDLEHRVAAIQQRVHQLTLELSDLASRMRAESDVA